MWEFKKNAISLADNDLYHPQNLTCIKRLIIYTQKQQQQHLRYLFPLSFSNSTQQAESKLFTFRFAPLYYYRIVCISCRMWKIVVWNSSSHAHECQKENVFLCVYILYGYLWQTRRNEDDGSNLICSKILKTHCYHTIKTFIALIALIY